MKIAMLGLRSIGSNASGGIEKAVEELSTRFVQHGHQVTVLCRARYNQQSEGSFRGVRLRSLPAIYTKHLEAISNTIAGILFTLRGYDIIHINATGPALLSFIPRIFRNKVVVTVHGLDWKREKWGRIAKAVLRLGARASAVFPHRTVVVSRTLKNHFDKFYGKDCVYIPNGVTLPGNAAGTSDAYPGLEKEGYVLFLSRLVPEKGCHTLISAFRRLNTSRKLVIVGEASHTDDYALSLRKLAEGDPRIVFTGALYGSDKDAIYRDAYFFVLPSTIEGMALVLLEAMSYGKCCLCSDIEENLEVIDPEPCGAAPAYGIRFVSGDVADLERRMAWLLENPDSVRALGEKARAYVAETFDWDRIAQEYLNVYSSLVNGSPSQYKGRALSVPKG